MTPDYNVQAEVNDFFEANHPHTRQRCDDYASKILGGDVSPVPIQGSFSYTVQAGPVSSMLVQFRTSTSPLNKEILALASDVHPKFVPETERLDDLDIQGSVLYVYKIRRVEGELYVRVRSNNPEPSQFQSTTVADFARFYAESLKKPQNPSVVIVQKQKDEVANSLKLLSDQLPPQFKEVLRVLQSQLPALYDPSYPLCLTHHDLSETNILVDSSTGCVTGIIDWADARVMPFGFALWGLLNIMGWMDAAGWHYYSNCTELEQTFWSTLEHHLARQLHLEERSTIRLASTVGIFIRYGFRWADNGAQRRVATDSDSSMRRLKALLDVQSTAVASLVMRDV
ncbi:hypothetical protein E8E11_001597 [Didymella keratinophila]|nr:hypothetical protein E8E11_001597 [Didymella keratinophila]